jgi:hypothetical protein
MKIKKATVTIRGTRPLLMHKFNVEVLSTDRKAKKGSAGNNPDEWRETVFSDADGNLFMPGDYFFACLKNGALHTKIGRGTIQKKVAATLQIISEKAMLNRKLPAKIDELTVENWPKLGQAPVYLDIRGVMNPASKGRNVRYRVACAPGWECTFECQWDETIVSSIHMRQVFEDAGILGGIADGRSIGMGRFEVLECQIVDFK